MFYVKLATQNIKKNRQAFMPFLLSMTFLGALNTLMLILANDQGLTKMHGAEALQQLFGFGAVVIIIFSVIFSIYTSSILDKQRKKELGLYNILGLGKRELARLTLVEMFFSFLITAVLGILSGIVFSRIAYLCLKKLLAIGTEFKFVIQPQTLFLVLGIIFLLFVFIYLLSLVSILRSDPIKFLQAAKEGEREPKAKWFVALLGFGALGWGYYLALTIESPVSAVIKFFWAVLLVIVGTYFLFTAGSIVILKLLRKNERYYYNNKHFIPLSGMIYRMKQNAVGLASICILSTMVLVTIGTTASLYFGEQDRIEQNFPRDVMITSVAKTDKLKQDAKAYAKKQGMTVTNVQQLKASEGLLFLREGQGQLKPVIRGSFSPNDADRAVNVVLMDLIDFNQVTGSSYRLEKASDILVYNNDKFSGKTLELGGEKLSIVKNLPRADELGNLGNGVTPAYLVVVRDQSVYDALVNKWYTTKDMENYRTPRYYLNFDIKGSTDKAKRLAFVRGLSRALAKDNSGYGIEFKDSYRQSLKIFDGGFFFIGIILGTAFLLATAMIIYYKQVSEGMDDHDRFVILQKVGMDRTEVKRVIHSQIMMVFIFPLAVAIMHVGFAFPLIKKMLILFGLNNWHLYLIVTLIVIAIFTLIYYLVYQLTARVYYRLIER
ncbi:ABC transporter permease [Ligilactobacillus faecis]|uniref:ABC transporter permease n=1 Tax=Ligilactobacillus faecis TaxID=762833 RepID=A0ABV4DRI0_9LACO